MTLKVQEIDSESRRQGHTCLVRWIVDPLKIFRVGEVKERGKMRKCGEHGQQMLDDSNG
jgi:hypothetical protein